jgi:pimeloyl-ACP methyl ester carboxylesterase
MAEDVEAFISENNIPPSILLGHSMGSKVAMALALRQPNKYAALIPVDNAPVDAALKSDFGKYVTGMKEVEDHSPKLERQSDADKILQKYEAEVSIRQFLLTNLVKTTISTDESGQTKPKMELKWRIPLATLAKALPDLADFPFKDPEVAQYKGPTLIVRGTKSHYVADDVLPLVGMFFPRFELLSLDAGHWVMSEMFEDFAKLVGDWIRSAVDGDGDDEGKEEGEQKRKPSGGGGR